MTDNQKLIRNQTEMSANVIQLGRFLRTKGFEIGPREELDALTALGAIQLKSEFVFENILRAVFAKTAHQYENFSDFYKDYLDQVDRASNSKVKDLQRHKSKRADQTPSIEALKDWLYGRPNSKPSAIASFSNIEVLGKKDFVNMSPEELKLIARVLAKIAQKIAHRKSRLRTRTSKRDQVDLRLTMRKIFSQGIDQGLVYSKRKDQKLNLVLLCDVSKSMDLYSRFFIQMIYAFHQGYDKIETFVFSTALHRVSDIMKNHDSEKALDIISERVPEWSGGTKIGSCFNQFIKDFGHSLLHRKSVVIILSDGWDADNSELIGETMKSIHRAARKVVWLNPLAGHPEFEPKTVGLELAMPYIDSFYPAHNLESLKRVIKAI